MTSPPGMEHDHDSGGEGGGIPGGAAGSEEGAAASGRFPVAHLRRGEGRRAESGHLWVFSNEIERFEGEPRHAGEILVRSARGRILGAGLYNRHTLIAIRLYSRRPRACDAALIRERLEQARARRRLDSPADAREAASAGGAWRAVFSEGDFLPGLILDLYAGHAVMQILTAGMEARREEILRAILAVHQPASLFERSDSPAREIEGLEKRAGPLHGAPDPELRAAFGDLRLRVDVAEGQKTGLFLDQAANWRAARRLAAGRRCLDLFCYQGAWSLSLARGGAAECLGIDASEAACRIARDNARENGLDAVCQFECADAFRALRDLEAARRRFGLIVLDPPAFAKSARQAQNALRGYREINLRAMRLLEPGGILITCSCSHHIPPDAFDSMLRQAAKDARRLFRVLPAPGQAPDHPVLLSTPETLYLKTRILEDIKE